MSFVKTHPHGSEPRDIDVFREMLRRAELYPFDEHRCLTTPRPGAIWSEDVGPAR